MRLAKLIHERGKLLRELEKKKRRNEYFGGFFALLGREKSPQLGHVFNHTGTYIVLLP